MNREAMGILALEEAAAPIVHCGMTLEDKQTRWVGALEPNVSSPSPWSPLVLRHGRAEYAIGLCVRLQMFNTIE